MTFQSHLTLTARDATLTAAFFSVLLNACGGSTRPSASIEDIPVADSAVAPTERVDTAAKDTYAQDAGAVSDVFVGPSEPPADAATATLVPMGRKLISVDWFSPTPDDLVTHLAQRQQLPFDGFAINLLIQRPSLRWPPTVFRTSQFDLRDMQLEKLRQIQWGKYTDNFIFVESQDYDDRNNFSWFSDPQWEGIKANASMLAQAIVSANARGIVLDIEHYEDPNPWAYNAETGRTFTQVSAVVQQRGREWAQNLLSGTTSFTFVVMGLYQMSQSYWSEGTRFENSRYALLRPFADGIISALRPQDKIIDAPEHFYWSTQTLDFSSLAKSTSDSGDSLMRTDLALGQRSQLKVGACLYFDFVWGLKPPPYNWDKGYAQDYKTRWLEHNVYHGLLSSDEYMWFYSEAAELDVFNGKFPSAALSAIEQGRKKLNQDQALGFNMSNVANAASEINSHKPPKATWTGNGTFNLVADGDVVKFIRVYRNGQPIPGDHAKLPLSLTFDVAATASSQNKGPLTVSVGDKLWATGFVESRLVVSNPVTVTP